MARSTWSFLIGIMSTFIYTCLAIFYFLYLLYLNGYIKLNYSVEYTYGKQGNKEFTSPLVMYVIACDLITFVAMIIASIFLQIGVKRERHQLLAAWLVLSGFVIAVALMGLIIFQSFDNLESIVNLSLILFHIIMSYFIYLHYREMRQQEMPRREICERQRNGAAYYKGRTSNSVYAPTTEGDNETTWSVITLPPQTP